MALVRFVVCFAALFVGMGSLSGEDKPLSRDELLSRARAANANAEYGEAWPYYARLLERHGDDLELQAEIARAATNVLRLKQAEEIIAKARSAARELEDKTKAKNVRKAIEEVARDVKRIRRQQKGLVSKVVDDAIKDLHKHHRAIPKSKMKVKKKKEGFTSYRLKDEYEGPHFWGFAAAFEMGYVTFMLYERYRDADRAHRRFRELLSLCRKRKPDWEKRYRYPGDPKLRMQGRSDAAVERNPASKGVTFCWNPKEPIQTLVADIHLTAPLVKDTKDVDPEGIWSIVVDLNSKWFSDS